MKTFKEFMVESVNENKNEDFLAVVDLKAAEKSVNDVVKKAIGADAGIKLTIGTGRRGKTIEVSSSDLTSKIGVKLFKKLYIHADSSTANDRGYWYMSLSYRWEHFGGGSNGTDIVALEFDASGKIIGTRDSFK